MPILIGNVLQSVNGSVNSIWVGNFLGEAALSATSNANAVMFLLLGAVFGLMHVMGDLTDPSKIGAGIAAAFVATFFGVWVANGIFLPMGNKLKTLSTDEVAYKKMLIEGILAIQAGTSPRVVEAVLMAQLPPKMREAAEAKAA